MPAGNAFFRVGVCVYLFSGFRRQCFNYAIPIAKSYPPMTSLPYLGLVVLPLRTPGGVFGERGFQLVHVSWLGLRGNSWKAVPQPRERRFDKEFGHVGVDGELLAHGRVNFSISVQHDL